MIANTILNVVIGLVFVFFVCSLAVSGMNEVVRKALNTRSKVLWNSIERILSEDEKLPQETDAARADSNETVSKMTAPVSIPAAPTRSTVNDPDAGSLFDRFFNHPVIGRLDPAQLGKRSKITNLPPADFARVLVDIVTPEDPDGNKLYDDLEQGINELPPVLRKQFQQLFVEAKQDVLQFRTAVEGWFDSSMDRVSDWYKKRTRWAMFGYGVIVAVAFNVSAIQVVGELYENDVVRQTVVDLAAVEAAQADADVAACADRQCVEEKISSLVDTGLPVLWRDCDAGDGYTACGFETGWDWVASIAGWMFTAAALSVGASFWFALLKKAFRVRSTLRGATS